MGGALNFGDTFAYALAKLRAAPLLYTGEDFSRTDVAAALAAGRRVGQQVALHAR